MLFHQLLCPILFRIFDGILRHRLMDTFYHADIMIKFNFMSLIRKDVVLEKISIHQKSILWQFKSKECCQFYMGASPQTPGIFRFLNQSMNRIKKAVQYTAPYFGCLFSARVASQHCPILQTGNRKITGAEEKARPDEKSESSPHKSCWN